VTLIEWMSTTRKEATCAEGDCQCKKESCDKTSCDADGSCTKAACSRPDCASGKCCKGKCGDATACNGNANCASGKCCKGSACYANECNDELNCLTCDTLTLTGPSVFSVPQPSPASGVSEELWQQIARELSGVSKPVRRVAFVTASPDETTTDDSNTENGPTQIVYNIQIVEDCQDCMSEYDELRRGATVMFAESKTLLPAMRMLHKYQAVRQLSSPKIICTCGQKAQLEIADTAEHKGVQLEVASEKIENGLNVQLAMHTKCETQSFEVKTSLLVEPGQTIVLNATPLPSKQNDAKPGETRAVYLMLTPVVVE
jgi:hypothetical protein